MGFCPSDAEPTVYQKGKALICFFFLFKLKVFQLQSDTVKRPSMLHVKRSSGIVITWLIDIHFSTHSGATNNLIQSDPVITMAAH